MQDIDFKSEHKRLLEIARWLSEQLRSMGMTVYGRHDDNDDAAVVFSSYPTMNSEDLAHLLDARGLQLELDIIVLNRYLRD